MKEKLLFSSLIMLCSIQIFGYNVVGGGNFKNQSVEISDSNSLTKPSNDSIESKIINDALVTTIETMKQENTRLLSEIGKLKSDTAEIAKRNRQNITQINDLNKIIKEKELSVKQYRDSANFYRGKFKNLENDITKLDAIIYKQCLLYPLEGRYDSLLIRESLRAIQSFYRINKKPSKEFLEYKETYEPLLRSYNQYNAQLFSFFESDLKYIKAAGGKIIEAHKTRFENELKQLPYYTDCYVNRNNPPYKSILYLDDVIDEFLRVLKKDGNVLEEISELLNKLKK